MRIAYADPPYPGEARKHYQHHPDYAGEVDHAELIARLVSDYPDGWALSTKTTALRDLLPLCPADVRLGAWVKPWACWKPGITVAYAWEPIIFRGGRKRSRAEDTVRDWVTANAVMRGRGGLHGTKPDKFCYWLFAVLGLQGGDTFDDLYPGSGAVSEAWGRYQRSMFVEVAP